MDIGELWRALGRAVGRRVVVVPLPTWVLYLAMRLSTIASSILGRKNQLDRKQYLQMKAPAFVCTSDKLNRDLGWRAQYDLASCVENAANGYRASALLRS
jgi:nucleoside-diphosphate-sugar epimerase